jgi:hypothetical protein
LEAEDASALVNEEREEAGCNRCNRQARRQAATRTSCSFLAIRKHKTLVFLSAMSKLFALEAAEVELLQLVPAIKKEFYSCTYIYIYVYIYRYIYIYMSI